MMTTLRAGRSEIHIPTGARDFTLIQRVQIGSMAHSAPYSMDTIILSRGQSGWSVKLTTDLHVALKLKRSGVVPLLAVYAFMAWTGRNLLLRFIPLLQGGSNMTGTNCDLFTHK